MEWQNYIVSDNNVLAGKPVIKGTRISVEFIIDRLASGWKEDDLLANYPRLKKQHLQAVFLYTRENLKDGLITNIPHQTA
jgi:uncharacterized protein (DUF433 family)